jgi:hypothetical protein
MIQESDMSSIRHVLMSAVTAVGVMAAVAVLTGGIAAAAEEEMAAPPPKKTKAAQAASPSPAAGVQDKPAPQAKSVTTDTEPAPRRTGKKRGLPSATESEND